MHGVAIGSTEIGAVVGIGVGSGVGSGVRAGVAVAMRIGTVTLGTAMVGTGAVAGATVGAIVSIAGGTLTVGSGAIGVAAGAAVGDAVAWPNGSDGRRTGGAPNDPAVALGAALARITGAAVARSSWIGIVPIPSGSVTSIV